MPMTKVRLYPALYTAWALTHPFPSLYRLSLNSAQRKGTTAFELLHDFWRANVVTCYASNLSRIALVLCPNYLSHYSTHPFRHHKQQLSRNFFGSIPS